MATGAGLILLGLIVEGGRGRSTGIGGKGVALKTEQVHLRALEKARVGIAVRGVARDTTFRLYDRVFVDKGPGFVAMALEAGSVLGDGGAELPGLETAVGIVTVVALHQALVDAVMEGTSKLLLDFQVAAVAKLRRLFFHQELTFLGVMGIVAIGAAHIVL